MNKHHEQRIVEVLKGKGLVVKTKHLRRYVSVVDGASLVATSFEFGEIGASWFVMQPCGGATEVRIFDAEKRPVALGAAFCSEEDHYDRATGRHLAFSRALQALRDGGYLSRGDLK